MEYLKTPYSILKGKTFVDNLSSSEKDRIAQVVVDMMVYGASLIYGETFQELFKAYQNGEDPAKNANDAIGIISNPEKIFAIHKAITQIASKYEYEVPNEENLVGGYSGEIYEKLLTPNSYIVVEPSPSMERETILIITNKDSDVRYVILPRSSDFTPNKDFYITVDKKGNVLIPKEGYDKNVRSI